jgi:hypothetical protein
MTKLKEENCTVDREAKLPRRDFFLLPAIGLLTVIAMFFTSEFLARMIWPEEERDACLVSDPVFHSRFRPNCKSKTKAAEGPWVENSYNQCGYRSKESCGPKPQGTVRVAVIGTSYSYGYMTPYNDMYTTVVANDLTRQCKRNVEFQNLGVPNVSLIDVYRRVDEALALKPDILLMVISEGDVVREISSDELAHRNEPPIEVQSAKTAAGGDLFRHHLVVRLKGSRAVVMLQHFMYQNPQTFANLYMAYGDNADFLRVPFTPRWEQRFSNLDVLLGDISKKAQDASVPMVLLLGLTPAQIALADSRPRPGVDANAFPAKIGEIAAKHHILAVNLLPSFTDRSDVNSLYYQVDGHASPKGHHVIADVLDKQLLSSGLPVFVGCSAK